MTPEDLQRAPPQLLTPRLRLEQPRIEHAAAVMDAINASLPELRFIAWGQQVVDRVWAEAFTQSGARFIERGDALIYYAFEREGGAFVGNLDLHHFEFATPRCEIGYVADSRQAGRGLMREAAEALIALAFRLGMQRIEAWSDVRNARAVRFALGLGFAHEGVMRAHDRDELGELSDIALLARLHPDLAR